MADDIPIIKERFAVEYVKNGGNASEAYRATHPDTTSTEEAIHMSASRYMADDRVVIRIKELQAHALAYAKVTIESLVVDQVECRDSAKADKDHSNWKGTNVELAKMTGQYEEKKSVKQSGVLTMVIDSEDAKL